MDLGSVDCEAKLYGKSMYYMPHLYAAREGGRGPPMQRRGPVLEASWCEYRGSVNAQDGMSKE